MGLPTVGKSSAVALVSIPVQQGFAFFVLLRGDLAGSETPLTVTGNAANRVANFNTLTLPVKAGMAIGLFAESRDGDDFAYIEGDLGSPDGIINLEFAFGG